MAIERRGISAGHGDGRDELHGVHGQRDVDTHRWGQPYRVDLSATWQMFTATVLAVSGSSGAYTITIDTPMTGIAPGAAIFPQAQNQAAYFAAVLNAFSTLGPGEWTASAPVLARSFRHPQPTNSWTYTLGAPFSKQLINVGPEVFDANWIYRSVGAGAPTVPGSITLDAFGNLTSTPPGVYVPRGLSWYAQ